MTDCTHWFLVQRERTAVQVQSVLVFADDEDVATDLAQRDFGRVVADELHEDAESSWAIVDVEEVKP